MALITKIFDKYAKYIWPLQRKFCKVAKRCSNCVLSEKYCTIMPCGYCEFCFFDIHLNKVETPDHFDLSLNDFINTNTCSHPNYQGLLLLSGGKDSIYTLARLRKEHPDFKLLCITVDNGHMAESALHNCRAITKQLCVDHMIHHINPEMYKVVMKNAFLQMAEGKTGYDVVDYADGSMVFNTAKLIAIQLKIPFVISGLSKEQVRSIVNHDSYVMNDQLFPMYYWNPSEKEIVEYINQFKGLKTLDPSQTNNDLIPAICAIDITNHGYCSFEIEFANMIRNGKMNRKEWLYKYELLEWLTMHGFLNKEIIKTVRKFGLEAFEVLMPK